MPKKKKSTTPLAEEFGNKFEGSIFCNTLSNSLKAHCLREFDEYSEVECKTLLARRVCKPVWGLGKGLESLDEYEGSEKVSKSRSTGCENSRHKISHTIAQLLIKLHDGVFK